MSDPIPNIWQPGEPRVGVIMGTGPSLTLEVVHAVRHLKRFGANRAFQFDIDVVLGCNYQFWDHYWPMIKDMRCHKWTSHVTQEHKRPEGLRWIEGRWEDGISTDPSWISYHHGSGPQILNLAYHYMRAGDPPIELGEPMTMLLVGWDMRFFGKVTRTAYSGPRHFFGEDVLTKGHWPRTGPQGELEGLIKEMETIADATPPGLEIINCTRDSSMKCFPFMRLEEALEKYAATTP